MEKSKKLGKDFLPNILFLGIFICTVIGCGNNSEGVISSDDIYFDDGYNKKINQSMPKITFVEEDFNFGIIIEGEKVAHTYKFENTGKSDLIISDVQTSCGCTTSKEYTRKPIKPGETGEIEVEFNSEDKGGDVKKAITVLTNSNPSKNILYILGEVISTENLEKIESN